MARSEARLLTSIWDDEDFIAQSPGAQRMYLLLLSQKNLNHAGLLPLTIKRWAAKGGTAAMVNSWLEELERNRYLVIDWDTEEVLIRSLLRGDKIWQQPQIMHAAIRAAGEITSPRLRSALAVEVARIQQMEGVLDTSQRHLATLAEALPEPSAEAFHKPSPTPPESPPESHVEGSRGQGMVTEVSTGSPNPVPLAPVPASPSAPRRDVAALCDRLADHIEANGSRRPAVTKAWTEAARLMLDRDDRPIAEAVDLLDWSQRDEFWRANILSMPTFRAKYDQLRLQRNRAPAGRSRNATILTGAMQRALEAEARQPERTALP